MLNLILSCLASLQAPVIMMSQNRVEAKDRIRGEHDYKINLKSELEIQLLHKKIDHLLATRTGVCLKCSVCRRADGDHFARVVKK